MQCPNCGFQNIDYQKFCGNCGYPIGNLEKSNNVQAANPQNFNSPNNQYVGFNNVNQQNIPNNNQAVYNNYSEDTEVRESDKILRGIALGINILTCFVFGIFVIPLCWMIPMTVHSCRIFQGEKDNTFGFAVCNLIFLNFISGILLLISKKADE